MRSIRRLALVTSLACLALAPVSRAHAALLLGIGDKCLDVEAGNTADGTPVNIFHCHGGFDQQWIVERGEIVGIGEKCLDVPSGNTTDGTPVQLFTCNGGANQQWSVR